MHGLGGAELNNMLYSILIVKTVVTRLAYLNKNTIVLGFNNFLYVHYNTTIALCRHNIMLNGPQTGQI